MFIHFPFLPSSRLARSFLLSLLRYTTATTTMRPAKRVTSPLRAGPIHGDELEHNRIQLEHNLQHTDLSLHLSSQPDSEQESEPHQNYESSVEYPRHNSGPEPFAVNAFASFDGEDFGGNMDSHSHIHAWSYRTADDDDAVNPYGGESMSTAAHHASALTLSAGLRGHGRQRDISLSGAEYDPERPLGDIIAGVDSRFTMLDVEPSKSRYQVSKLQLLLFHVQLLIYSAECFCSHIRPAGRRRYCRIRTRSSFGSRNRSVLARCPLAPHDGLVIRI